MNAVTEVPPLLTGAAGLSGVSLYWLPKAMSMMTGKAMVKNRVRRFRRRRLISMLSSVRLNPPKPGARRSVERATGAGAGFIWCLLRLAGTGRGNRRRRHRR